MLHHINAIKTFFGIRIFPGISGCGFKTQNWCFCFHLSTLINSNFINLNFSGIRIFSGISGPGLKLKNWCFLFTFVNPNQLQFHFQRFNDYVISIQTSLMRDLSNSLVTRLNLPDTALYPCIQQKYSGEINANQQPPRCVSSKWRQIPDRQQLMLFRLITTLIIER